MMTSVGTWLITGCSSGLGRALAEVALASGDNVVLTARDPATVRDLVDRHPDTSLAVALDVTEPEQLGNAVHAAVARFGGVDVLVNNAGYGYRAAVEEAADDDVRQLFETNFFGAVALTKLVLPGMRANRRGAVVNISSLSGRFASPGSAFYSASKFALEGLSDALRKEVGPLGIKVIVVEPGALRTDFRGRSLQEGATQIGDYAGTVGLRRKKHDRSHGTQAGDPLRAAHAIVQGVKAPRSPFRLALGDDAVDGIRAEIDIQRQELEEWEHISRSIAFET